MKQSTRGQDQFDKFEAIKKTDNTTLMMALSPEDQQKVKDYIFSGGQGENPLAELRKKAQS